MQKQWLNYHHLLYFEAIATSGSVAGAAAALRLGQSTLSTQLGQFESQLDVKLFERRKQRLHLTEAGRVALQYASEIFKLGEEMVDALHDRRRASRISVQLGALDSVPKALVVELVAAAQSHQPCTVSVVEGQVDELLRALKAHEIDLALISHQPPAADRVGLTARMASRTPVVILGSAKFSRLSKGFPESLSDQPFVMPGTESRMRHEVDDFFRLQGIRADVVLEAQDTSLLTLLAADGAGLIPVSSAAIGQLSEKHGLKLIGTLPDVHDELWLVGSVRRIGNPVASFLAEHFKPFSPT